MKYARVENGSVVEQREMDPPPEHKAALWRPVVIEGSGPIETTTIEAERVLVSRSSVPLSTLKADLKARVSSDAESCRLKFITPGSGKAMSYMEKHNQANAVHDMGEAAADALSFDERKAQFPTLSATVGIDAPTLWGVAQIVIARYEAWATISYDIELAEAAGKKAISDASDAAAARAAYEAITWPSP